jgi:hypothetical protein
LHRGPRSRDSTTIVVTCYDREAKKVRLITHKIFQPSPDDPLDFEATVETSVRTLYSRFRVQQVLYDPYQMAAVAQRLARNHVPMIEYPQSVPNLTEMATILYELFKGRNPVIYPDDAVRLPACDVRGDDEQSSVGSRSLWRLAARSLGHPMGIWPASVRSSRAAARSANAWRSGSRVTLICSRRADMPFSENPTCRVCIEERCPATYWPARQKMAPAMKPGHKGSFRVVWLTGRLPHNRNVSIAVVVW